MKNQLVLLTDEGPKTTTPLTPTVRRSNTTGPSRRRATDRAESCREGAAAARAALRAASHRAAERERARSEARDAALLAAAAQPRLPLADGQRPAA